MEQITTEQQSIAVATEIATATEESLLNRYKLWAASVFNFVRTLFTPNAVISPSAFKVLVIAQLATMLYFWSIAETGFLPNLSEIWEAFKILWFEHALGRALLTSFWHNLQALSIAATITLILAYSTRMPFFVPVVKFISGLRYLSFVGLSVIFILYVGGGFQLKLSMLVFGITVYYLTSMLEVVDSVEEDQRNLSRTLKMSEWGVVWETTVLGTLHQAWDALRQNNAVGWMMLIMAESLVRSSGGVGVLLVDENKHFLLAGVYAIQICIFFGGVSQDFIMGAIGRAFAPHAKLKTKR